MTTVELRYRAADGREILLTLPVPTAPALVRALDDALAKMGYTRVDEAS